MARPHALKILAAWLSDDDEFRERFRREVELAATLSHPHIVGVHDHGEFNGQLWIAATTGSLNDVQTQDVITKPAPAVTPLLQTAVIVPVILGVLLYGTVAFAILECSSQGSGGCDGVARRLIGRGLRGFVWPDTAA